MKTGAEGIGVGGGRRESKGNESGLVGSNGKWERRVVGKREEGRKRLWRNGEGE